jgi:hypothetical protein
VHLEFTPPLIDFGSLPLCEASSRSLEVKLTTLLSDLDGSSTNIRVLYITGLGTSDAQFRAALTSDVVALRQGGFVRLNVVVLPDQVGPTTANLTLYTSAGSTTIPLRSVGEPSPFRVRPITGLRLPVGMVIHPELRMFNPHSVPLRVLEVSSVDGNVRVVVPEGATVTVPSHSESVVASLTIAPTAPGKVRDLVRIVTSSTEFLVPVTAVAASGGFTIPRVELGAVLRSRPHVMPPDVLRMVVEAGIGWTFPTAMLPPELLAKLSNATVLTARGGSLTKGVVSREVPFSRETRVGGADVAPAWTWLTVARDVEESLAPGETVQRVVTTHDNKTVILLSSAVPDVAATVDGGPLGTLASGVARLVSAENRDVSPLRLSLSQSRPCPVCPGWEGTGVDVDSTVSAPLGSSDAASLPTNEPQVHIATIAGASLPVDRPPLPVLAVRVALADNDETPSLAARSSLRARPSLTQAHGAVSVGSNSSSPAASDRRALLRWTASLISGALLASRDELLRESDAAELVDVSPCAVASNALRVRRWLGESVSDAPCDDAESPTLSGRVKLVRVWNAYPVPVRLTSLTSLHPRVLPLPMSATDILPNGHRVLRMAVFDPPSGEPPGRWSSECRSTWTGGPERCTRWYPAKSAGQSSPPGQERGGGCRCSVASALERAADRLLGRETAAACERRGCGFPAQEMAEWRSIEWGSAESALVAEAEFVLPDAASLTASLRLPLAVADGRLSFVGACVGDAASLPTVPWNQPWSSPQHPLQEAARVARTNPHLTYDRHSDMLRVCSEPLEMDLIASLAVPAASLIVVAQDLHPFPETPHDVSCIRMEWRSKPFAGASLPREGSFVARSRAPLRFRDDEGMLDTASQGLAERCQEEVSLWYKRTRIEGCSVRCRAVGGDDPHSLPLPRDPPRWLRVGSLQARSTRVVVLEWKNENPFAVRVLRVSVRADVVAMAGCHVVGFAERRSTPPAGPKEWWSSKNHFVTPSLRAVAPSLVPVPSDEQEETSLSSLSEPSSDCTCDADRARWTECGCWRALRNESQPMTFIPDAWEVSPSRLRYQPDPRETSTVRAEPGATFRMLVALHPPGDTDLRMEVADAVLVVTDHGVIPVGLDLRVVSRPHATLAPVGDVSQLPVPASLSLPPNVTQRLSPVSRVPSSPFAPAAFFGHPFIEPRTILHVLRPIPPSATVEARVEVITLRTASRVLVPRTVAAEGGGVRFEAPQEVSRDDPAMSDAKLLWVKFDHHFSTCTRHVTATEGCDSVGVELAHDGSDAFTVRVAHRCHRSSRHSLPPGVEAVSLSNATLLDAATRHELARAGAYSRVRCNGVAEQRDRLSLHVGLSDGRVAHLLLLVPRQHASLARFASLPTPAHVRDAQSREFAAAGEAVFNGWVAWPWQMMRDLTSLILTEAPASTTALPTHVHAPSCDARRSNAAQSLLEKTNTRRRAAAPPTTTLFQRTAKALRERMLVQTVPAGCAASLSPSRRCRSELREWEQETLGEFVGETPSDDASASLRSPAELSLLSTSESVSDACVTASGPSHGHPVLETAGVAPITDLPSDLHSAFVATLARGGPASLSEGSDVAQWLESDSTLHAGEVAPGAVAGVWIPVRNPLPERLRVALLPPGTCGSVAPSAVWLSDEGFPRATRVPHGHPLAQAACGDLSSCDARLPPSLVPSDASHPVAHGALPLDVDRVPSLAPAESVARAFARCVASGHAIGSCQRGATGHDWTLASLFGARRPADVPLAASSPANESEVDAYEALLLDPHSCGYDGRVSVQSAATWSESLRPGRATWSDDGGVLSSLALGSRLSAELEPGQEALLGPVWVRPHEEAPADARAEFHVWVGSPSLPVAEAIRVVASVGRPVTSVLWSDAERPIAKPLPVPLRWIEADVQSSAGQQRQRAWTGNASLTGHASDAIELWGAQDLHSAIRAQYRVLVPSPDEGDEWRSFGYLGGNGLSNTPVTPHTAGASRPAVVRVAPSSDGAVWNGWSPWRDIVRFHGPVSLAGQTVHFRFAASDVDALTRALCTTTTPFDIASLRLSAGIVRVVVQERPTSCDARMTTIVDPSPPVTEPEATWKTPTLAVIVTVLCVATVGASLWRPAPSTSDGSRLAPPPVVAVAEVGPSMLESAPEVEHPADVGPSTVESAPEVEHPADVGPSTVESTPEVEHPADVGSSMLESAPEVEHPVDVGLSGPGPAVDDDHHSTSGSSTDAGASTPILELPLVVTIAAPRAAAEHATRLDRTASQRSSGSSVPESPGGMLGEGATPRPDVVSIHRDSSLTTLRRERSTDSNHQHSFLLGIPRGVSELHPSDDDEFGLSGFRFQDPFAPAPLETSIHPTTPADGPPSFLFGVGDAPPMFPALTTPSTLGMEVPPLDVAFSHPPAVEPTTTPAWTLVEPSFFGSTDILSAGGLGAPSMTLSLSPDLYPPHDQHSVIRHTEDQHPPSDSS